MPWRRRARRRPTSGAYRALGRRDGRRDPLHTLLDPSGIVLFVAHGGKGGAVDAKLRQTAGAASVPIPIVEILPPAAGSPAAPAAIEAFVRKWLTLEPKAHA